MQVLDHAALTHPGTVRQLNEDSVLASPPVFCVADGIGGNEAGEVASAIVVEALAGLAHQVDGTGVVEADAVAEALERAHAKVLQLHDDGPYGAGSTACGAVVVAGSGGPYWLLFNIGDSRLYRCEPGVAPLSQVSVDHSHVQELVDAGVITADQAESHPERNLVTRAIGSDDGFDPDYWLRPLVPGERLLICSDGLVDGRGLADLAAVTDRGDPAEQTAEALLALALAGGARDNVSVIIVDVISVGDRRASDRESLDDQQQTVIVQDRGSTSGAAQDAASAAGGTP